MPIYLVGRIECLIALNNYTYVVSAQSVVLHVSLRTTYILIMQMYTQIYVHMHVNMIRVEHFYL